MATSYLVCIEFHYRVLLIDWPRMHQLIRRGKRECKQLFDAISDKPTRREPLKARGPFSAINRKVNQATQDMSENLAEMQWNAEPKYYQRYTAITQLSQCCSRTYSWTEETGIFCCFFMILFPLYSVGLLDTPVRQFDNFCFVDFFF